MSALHISLLAVRALISTTVLIHVLHFFSARRFAYDSVSKCVSVCAVFLYVAFTFASSNFLLIIMSLCDNGIVHSFSLTAGQVWLTRSGRKCGKMRKVSRRWRVTLNGDSRSGKGAKSTEQTNTQAKSPRKVNWIEVPHKNSRLSREASHWCHKYFILAGLSI